MLQTEPMMVYLKFIKLEQNFKYTKLPSSISSKNSTILTYKCIQKDTNKPSQFIHTATPKPAAAAERMTGSNHSSERGRALGHTEQNWCRAVASGTGITVLALKMAKPPPEIAAALAGVVENLLKNHPILAAKLHYNRGTKAFSFLKPTTPSSHMIKLHDVVSTSHLLHTTTTSPFQTILEHELNSKSWSDPSSFPCMGIDVFYITIYSLSEADAAVVLRFHTSVCDRTTAVSLLRELMEMVAEGEGTQRGIKNEGEGEMGIESMVPCRVGKKTLWAHGIDMLGYSVNSLRLTNLSFEITKMPRRSELVRLHMNTKHTNLIIQGCKSRGIKVCGAMAAAALMAAHSTKQNSTKKYGVVTFTDCRPILDPPLTTRHYGFYNSAILNIHTVKGRESLWDLAKTCYSDFAHYKKCNKQFSDMADLNFLMSKAIENPSLTASSSLRTSLVTVFEDPVLDNTSHTQEKIGVEDYMGCASVHGVGPSIAIFDTIRDGELDCICVYPAPLHSRAQMNDLLDRMARIIIDGVSEF